MSVTEDVIFNAEDHTYADPSGTYYPSVNQILVHAGLCDFSMISDEDRERAFSRGTAVHWLTQLEDQGALNYRKLTKPMRGFRKAFTSWKRNSGFVPLEIEKPFINRQGYAGTPDRFGYFPPTAQIPYKTFAIVDFKTGAGVMDWVRYQLAGYVYQKGNIRAIRRIAVCLMPDGTYKVREFPRETIEHDFAVFIAALKKWRKENAEGIAARSESR